MCMCVTIVGALVVVVSVLWDVVACCCHVCDWFCVVCCGLFCLWCIVCVLVLCLLW